MNSKFAITQGFFLTKTAFEFWKWSSTSNDLLVQNGYCHARNIVNCRRFLSLVKILRRKRETAKKYERRKKVFRKGKYAGRKGTYTSDDKDSNNKFVFCS